MKSKEHISNFWNSISFIQKGLTLVIGISSVCGIVYAVFSFFHSRENKISSAMSHKEVIELFDAIDKRVGAVQDSFHLVLDNQADFQLQVNALNYNFGIVDRNFRTIKTEMVGHIRKSQDTSPDQRLDDILRILNGIDATIKEKKMNFIMDTTNFNFTYDRIWPVK